ncbi:14561_t:CDS:2 [Entrophospora sp. SA101]|nr:16519_t:CDS:2 [Entrophospora sp. SA101]CAJ0755965.1 14561_t:CDS:2 [Entrophospora sp. SA101]
MSVDTCALYKRIESGLRTGDCEMENFTTILNVSRNIGRRNRLLKFGQGDALDQRVMVETYAYTIGEVYMKSL